MAYNSIKDKERKEVNKMTREQMMDEIIRQYGFECGITIAFCTLAEDSTVSDTDLRKAFDVLVA